MRNGTPIPNATQESLVINNLQLSDMGELQLSASNQVYSTLSNPLEMVVYNPLQIDFDPNTQNYLITANVEANTTWQIQSSSNIADWNDLENSPFISDDNGTITVSGDFTSDTLFRAKGIE